MIIHYSTLIFVLLLLLMLLLSLLQSIPKDVKTYEALGRAFVLTEREQVFKNLDKINSDTEQKITVLEVNIPYV